MWLIDDRVDAERLVVLRRVGAGAARPHRSGRAACPGCGRSGCRCRCRSTFAGMSIRGNDLPTTLVLADRLRDALPGISRDAWSTRCLVERHREVEQLAADQVAVLDALAAAGDDAGRDAVRLATGTPSFVDAMLEQHLLRVRRRRAGLRRAARDAARAAAAARGVQPRLGVRIDHLVHVHVQLFGDEHQDAGRGAVTELRLAVGDDDRVVRRDRDPRVDLRSGPAGSRCGPRAANGVRPFAAEALPACAERREADDQRAAALDERLA